MLFKKRFFPRVLNKNDDVLVKSLNEKHIFNAIENFSGEF